MPDRHREGAVSEEVERFDGVADDGGSDDTGRNGWSGND